MIKKKAKKSGLSVLSVIMSLVTILILFNNCHQEIMPETLEEPVVNALTNTATTRIFQAPTTETGNCYNYDAVTTCGSYSCNHAGKDYCGANTDNVVAIGSGRIVFVSTGTDDNRGLGRVIVIAHKRPDGTNLYSLYSHLSSVSSDIALNRYVTKGYVIGKKGSSGSGSNQIVHLHFETKNHSGLGHNPNCTGTGCVGYVRKDLLPVSSKGYFNPNSLIGTAEYDDFVLNGNLPSTISKSGVNIPVTFRSPFTDNITVDIRVSLYDTNGTYRGDIQSYTNVVISNGNRTINFSKTSLTSPVGTYQLHIDYKMPSSGTWITLPVWSNFQNRKTVSLTN